MSLTKRIGLGVTLEVDLTGGTSYTTLGNVVEAVNGPDAKATIVPVELLTEEFVDKAKGAIDGGTVTYSVAYDPDDTHSKLIGDAFLQRTPVPRWRVAYPGATEPDVFLAHCSAVGRERKKDGFIVAPITLDVVGDPGFTRS